MTRAERIKIRAERVRLRDERNAKNALLPPPEPKPISEAVLKAIEEQRLNAKKDKLTIEICIHCFRYQKRLTWMLSSILQQKGDIPNLIINISHTDNDGTPTTEEVCKFFREKGLQIEEFKMTEKEVCNRAIARNYQVSKTTADWILFVDSDMVYSTGFFSDLQNQLKHTITDITTVMGGDRYSLDDKFCIKYFEDDKTVYPCIIENVAELASKWPVKWVMGRGTAPGFFQLAGVPSVKAHGGKYTGRAQDFWRGTKSDRHFRLTMGGRTPIFVKEQFHLNHDRQGPELQR